MGTWANDTLEAELPKAKTKPSSDYLNFDSDSNSDSGQESEEEPAGEDPEGESWGCQAGLSRKGPARSHPPAVWRISSLPIGVSTPGRSGHLTQPVLTKHVQYARHSSENWGHSSDKRPQESLHLCMGHVC